MRAKFIYENVSDVLKPKTKEEIEANFKEQMRISMDKYKMYAKQLEDLGVEIQELWSWRIKKMTIKTYKAYAQNWNIGTAATKENALAMMQTHKQYSLEGFDYHIDDDHAYLDLKDIKNLIRKLQLNIQHTTKYASDSFSNLNTKHNYPEYKEWRDRNWDEIFKRDKEEWEKSNKVEESIKDVLKPKSDKDIEKGWPNDNVSYKSFKKVLNHLKKMGINIRGVSTTFGIDFVVNGYYLIRNNVGVMRVMTYDDAQKLINAIDAVSYQTTDFKIDDETMHVSFEEAKNYLKKRGIEV